MRNVEVRRASIRPGSSRLFDNRGEHLGRGEAFALSGMLFLKMAQAPRSHRSTNLGVDVHLPTHAAVNLVALDQWTTPEQRPWVFLGALMPDLPVLAFYFVCRYILGLSDDEIWKDVYYRDRWFNVFATFHSIPLTAGLCGLGIAVGSHALALFGASMCMHNLVDLPLHAKDAHRHFFPFSNYRFKSPISYWNPTYWGRVVAAGEMALLAACSFTLYPVLVSPWAKGALLFANAAFVVAYVAFYLGPYGDAVFGSIAPD